MIPRNWSPGEVLLEEYEILRLSGTGGYGMVYQVRRRADGAVFALKALLDTILSNLRTRRMFLRELSVWVDLPPHPNLLQCLFFRTIQDRLAIFCEYLQGGSLKKWILNTERPSLESLLDISIQTARGLQAAHDQNVVHQDIKPANIMFTSDGTVKIIDFGLAYIRPKPAQVDPEDSDIPEGMTLAYCSPEQAYGKPVDNATDIWSWGLTVLEMFTGPATWKIGTIAPRLLDRYERIGGPQDYPRMPDSLISLLWSCFIENPRKRLRNAGELVERLEKIYRESTGQPYPRSAPRRFPGTLRKYFQHDRRTVTGARWDDPELWIEKIKVYLDDDSFRVKPSLPRGQRSVKSQALADLDIYNQVEAVFSRLDIESFPEIKRDFARFLVQKSLIHANIDDMPHAITLLKRARKRLAEIPVSFQPDNIRDDRLFISRIYGNILFKQGRYDDALREYRRALRLLKQAPPETSGVHQNLRAILHSNIGVVSARMGRYRTAAKHYNTAIDILEAGPSQAGAEETRRNLAFVYLNKGALLGEQLKNRAACSVLLKAADILESFRDEGGEDDMVTARDLIVLYNNLAIIFQRLGRMDEARRSFQQSIRICSTLVYKKGRREFLIHLAVSCINLAHLAGESNRLQTALSLFDRAIDIWETLVFRESRTDLAGELAKVFFNKAVTLSDLGRPEEAVEFCDKALAIFENDDFGLEASDIKLIQALTYMNKANMLNDLGRTETCLPLYRQAEAIIDTLEAAGSLPDDKLYRALIAINKATVLPDSGEALAAIDTALANLEAIPENDRDPEIIQYIAVAGLEGGRILLKDGRTEAALAYLRRADDWPAPGDTQNLSEKTTEAIHKLRIYYAAALADLGRPVPHPDAVKQALHHFRKNPPPPQDTGLIGRLEKVAALSG